MISNYRPISVIPFLSKILEKCLFVRISGFIKRFSLISTNQFGFSQGISTSDALSSFTNFIHEALDKKQHTLNVFVDYSKAFDTVKHSILLSKLERYGFRGLSLNLIASYLENRRQRVKIGDAVSDEKQIHIGLPQGSILAPTLFLLYINDLSKLSNCFYPIQFADDTTLIFKNNDFNDLVNCCNGTLDTFYRWSTCNRLTINVEKSHYTIISNRLTNQTDILLNNSKLNSVDSCKFLGVTIDNKLKFDIHSQGICSKISKTIGVLYRIKNFVPCYVLKQLYFSFIYPYLNYCISVWGSTFSSHTNNIFLLQKRAIRVICKKDYFAHTSPLFYSTKILKLQDIYKFNVAIQFFKNRNNLNYDRNHSYLTRSRNTLRTPLCRLTYTQQSVNYQGPLIWNEIPIDIKESRSISTFKYKFKNYLINQYNN